MTLKEKFETKVSIDTTKEAKAFAKEYEQIADDYAYAFAFWLFYEIDVNLVNKTIKEQLQIFKKEKGL